MPATGGFKNPVLFLAVCGVVYLIFKLVVSGPAGAVNAVFLIILSYIFGPGIGEGRGSGKRAVKDFRPREGG